MNNDEAETGKQERLSATFSAFRQGTGVPPWMVSDMAVGMYISQSDKWEHLMSPLGLEHVVCFFNSGGDIEQLSPGRFTEESRRWAKFNQVRDTLLAVYRLLMSADELYKQGKMACPSIMIESVPILSIMFWCPQGRRIARQVGEVLGCDPTSPADIYDSYRIAMESGDEAKLVQIKRLIDSDPVFGSWSNNYSDAAANTKRPARQPTLPYAGLAPTILLNMLDTEVRYDHN
jgi:hypothetical protein